MTLIRLFVSISFLMSSWALAQKKSDLIPLHFQADKNNIQILPQRFEYNLGDEDNIKIGDIPIDSTSFGFQVATSQAAPGKYRARFVWPAGLLMEGSISIRDNTGKTIWSLPIRKKNVRLVASKVKTQNNLDRTQVAELVIDYLEPKLIEDMKYLPFMNFCINRVNQETSIYLCSKEVYLTVTQGKIGIRSRSETKRTPFVEINGKSVSNQGVIFLNDENETIGFRAMTQSGAILEVETRMRPVDFKDVIMSDDQKNLILTASGTEPVNEEKVKRISETEWQFLVDVQRPILYLKGDGDIPMRQEFYIKGPVPTEKLRPFLDASSENRIYKSQITVTGQGATGTTVFANEKNERLEKIDASEFRWTLTEIPEGLNSRHYVRVNDDKNSFLAGYDVYRDYALEAGLLGSFWLPANQLYANANLTWWIDDFFGNSQEWARLHWGLRIDESLVLNKKDGEANVNITHLELLWRAKSGFHFTDKSWGLILPYEMIQATGVSIASPGFGAFYSDKAPRPYLKWFHWYDTKLIYLLGGGSDIKLKSAIQLSALAYYHYTKQLSWSYGLGLNQYSFDPSPSKTQFQLMGGANYRF